MNSSLLLLFPKWVQKVVVQSRELTIVLKNAAFILPVLETLQQHSTTQFKMLVDLTAVDYPSRSSRFEVVYHLLSLQQNQRIRVKVKSAETTPIDSVTHLFPSANYGFEGHPLRKDFPLSGYLEFKYDDSKKRVIAEPVELAQQFRKFEFRSPWEVIPQKF